ncbi:senescence-associated protein-domain-containing protein [Mycena rebaudengoi]|nr:senescence-associated protein-domain-containing protein [Mycena rebaudengoi]
MALSEADGILLLNLANCTLATGTTSQSGTLALECVTLRDRDDVYLVLKLNSTELPIDPTRIIDVNVSESGSRKYTFLPTDADPVQLSLTVAVPNLPDAHFLEDVEVFESILAQYATLRDASVETPPPPPPVLPRIDDPELRGHLVLVNQDNGEVVGEFDRKFSLQEDPALSKKGHEDDPVIIELAESGLSEGDARAMEMFVRAIPPDQHDWITRGATIISHAISGSTSLLLTTISAASSYYTSHSTPAASTKSSGSSTSPPLPPRAVAFLASARTRKGLATVHSVSGQAVKVSGKTVALIDSMIKRAIGSAKGKQSTATLAPGPPLPPRSTSPSFPPPPYTSSPGEKPSLPPRRQPSPAPASAPPTLPPRKVSTTARILLSADLILSTIDHSTRRLLDSGTQTVGTVVGHKYGAEAGQSSVLMAGTARNVALVYIDMSGIGRRALLRRAGKEYVKGKLADRKS